MVVLCAPVPTVDVTGPGAVGMSNVFDDGRKGESEADESGCVDAGGGGGFCGGARLVAGAGECIRLDGDGGTGASAGGAGVGVGEGEGGCVWTSDDEMVAWVVGGRVMREADMSDGCTTAGYWGDVN
jgi:hypothetical protein